MKTFLYSLLAVLALTAAVGAQTKERGSFIIPPAIENMSLESMFGANLENGEFNGGDWVVGTDGVITSPGDGEIWTKEKYGSFICTFEFDAEDKADAGFLIHAADKKKWFPCTVEVQLLGDGYRLQDEKGKPTIAIEPNYHTCGAFYGYQAASQNVTKPKGKWNKMTVVALGTRLMVELNGVMINMIDTAEWTDNVYSPLGTEIEEQFRGKSLAEQEPYGYIGFRGKQGDLTIRYRNIKFAPIAEPVIPGAANVPWEPLFGEKLENAEYDPDVWSVDADGVIHATKDDTIWAKGEFGDAIIKFEFMTTKNANSGVIIQCTDKANWIPNALEVQILDSFEHGNGMDQCGAVYGRCPTAINVCKAPGQWNEMTIATVGSVIDVYMNGTLITHMNKSKWTDAAANPDGSEVFSWLVNKAPSKTPNSGFIGFQGLHEGHPVVFRNAKVKRLSAAK
ncbi:MAG: DUF1080 domain-containing protein [Thermoguttaceae bacterium]|nr:DUF1080 domain-containing protein [Thermoguttaceae bacterium]